MLINATQPEELRLALVDGQSLYDFDLEQLGYERKRANIYKAKVSRVEPSLGAAFVDYGSEKHGFLPMKDIAPQYAPNGKITKHTTVKDCLKEGQELIIQVEKEERGNKGAAISTYITLAGHYIVLLPNNAEAGGISKSLEGKDRDSIKEAIRSLDVPNKMGLIVRTAAKGATAEELSWDLGYLLSVWDAIIEANQLRKAPFLVYRESDLITRSLRDYLRDDIKEVLIDSEDAHEKALDFITKLMPEYEEKIKYYQDTTPLFSKYQIETQIEAAQRREVVLPSGGSISIDHTEALVAIDINSAKSTKGTNIEDTAIKTNLEAASEVAKQLRLRDIGGLIVIDFIDMTSLKNKRLVEEAVWNAVDMDRAKIQVGRISRFGLLEMSRQRIRPSLQERWQQDISSLSTAVLRLIEEESAKENSLEIRAKVSTEMSVYLLNERRDRIHEIEQKASIRIVIKADPTREDDRFEVTRIRVNDAKNNKVPSEKNTEKVKEESKKVPFKPKKLEIAAVDVKPKARPSRKKDGFFSRLIKSLTSKKETAKPVSQISKNKQSVNNKNRSNRPARTRRPNQNQNQNPNQKKNPNQNKNKNIVRDKVKGNEKKEVDGNKAIPERKPTKPRNTKTPIKEVDGNKAIPERIPNNANDTKTPKKAVDENKASNLKTTSKGTIKEKEESSIEHDKKLKAQDWGTAANDPRKKGANTKKEKISKEVSIIAKEEVSKEAPIMAKEEVSKEAPITKKIDINKINNKDLEKVEDKEQETTKSAKDWGTASNDPRKKE